MMVMTNSTTPSPINAARNVPLASPNWLAMTAAMASWGAKRWTDRDGVDPMTKKKDAVYALARTEIDSPTERSVHLRAATRQRSRSASHQRMHVAQLGNLYFAGAQTFIEREKFVRVV